MEATTRSWNFRRLRSLGAKGPHDASHIHQRLRGRARIREGMGGCAPAGPETGARKIPRRGIVCYREKTKQKQENEETRGREKKKEESEANALLGR